MIRWISTACAALAIASAFSFAAAKELATSPPCSESNAISSTEVEFRKARILRDLAAKRKELSKLRADQAVSSIAGLEEEVSDLEAELVDSIYLLHCLTTAWEAVRGSGEVIELTTFFGTNRRPEAPSHYGSEDADEVHYGRMVVAIPAVHVLGNLELPHIWKLERGAELGKHFVVRSIVPLPTDRALLELRRTLGELKNKTLLLYIHGFNVSFSEAGMRTAQLAYDLDFQGIPMFFSWPATKYYTHDVEAVELAKAKLDRALSALQGLPFENIYIIAHSLGNRLLTKVLASRQLSGISSGRIREVMLAAPDINTEIFRMEVAPAFQQMSGVRKTIYASSNDLALNASRSLHGYQRVGDTSGGVFVYPSFETIDSSKAAPTNRAWGHSYVFDSTAVLGDLSSAIVAGKEISKRGLKRVGRSPSQYWVIE